MKLHRYVDHQRLHIVTKDVISLSISVLLLFRHYISHKITFGAPSSGGVLRSACGAFIFRFRFGGRKKFSRTNSKTSKVNQQSVSNLLIFHHFPKYLDWTITLTVSLSKIHRQNLKNILLFFNETNTI